MKFKKTSMNNLFIIEPNIYSDDRGYFFESFNEIKFKKKIDNLNFVQDNESKSTKGVLRGFHFQNPPFDQAKLVRCIKGKILDVVIDLRLNSKTYGESFKIILSHKNKKQLFIPRGFAHAFLVLSKTAIFSYKVDNIYSAKHENGIIWNDSSLSIDWGINESQVIISDKDKNLSEMSTFKSPFKN